MDGYQKHTGLSLAGKGARYQSKVAAFAVVEALIAGNIPFELSSENESATPFDDVVISFNNRQEFRFIQVKHREPTKPPINFRDLIAKEGSNKKDPFNLVRYLKGFVNICRETFKGSPKKEFVIYTPASMKFDNKEVDDGKCLTITDPEDENVKLKFKKVTDMQHLSIVNPEISVIYTLERDSHIIQNLLRNYDCKHTREEVVEVCDCKPTEKEVDDFFKHLVFVVNQPTEEEYNKFILEKFELLKTGLSAESVQTKLVENLFEWLNKPGQGQYYTEADVAETYLQILSSDFINSIKLDEVEYEEFAKLQDFLNSHQHTSYICTDSAKLCCNRIWQFCDRLETHIIKITSLLKFKEFLWPYLPLKRNHVLVVVMCEMTDLAKETLEELCNKYAMGLTEMKVVGKAAKKKNVSSRVIKQLLIVFENVTRLKVIKDLIGMELDTASFNLSSLSEASRESLLRKRITFEGRKIELSQLVDKESWTLIDSSTIECLALNEEVVIGKPIREVHKMVSQFIPRTLYVNHVKLSPFPEAVFAFIIDSQSVEKDGYISSLKLCSHEDIMKQSTSFTRDETETMKILLDSRSKEEQCIQLCKQFSDSDVHMLRYCGNKMFVLCESNSFNSLTEELTHSTITLHQQRNRKSLYETSPTRISDFEDQNIVVLAAEPGMGKTTYLAYLAEKEKMTSPNTWVVVVNLKDVSKEMSNIILENKSVNILHCMCEVISKGDKRTQSLLQDCLERTGNFCLLMDGYDEISSEEERNVVLKLLAKLKAHRKGKVIISTRLQFQNILEHETGTFAYRLKPFAESEQEESLAKTWTEKLARDGAGKERVSVYTKKLIKETEHIKKTLGSPLLIKMLAEARKDECDYYCQNCIAEYRLQPVNIVSLFEEYIYQSCRTFLKEEGLNVGTFFERESRALDSKCSKLYVRIAIEDLYPNEGLLRKHLPNYQADLDMKDILRIGIVQQRERNLTLVHKTTAEYIIANFIHVILKERGVVREVKRFLLKYFFTKNFLVIRKFLDILLVGNDLQKAVIDNDFEECKKAIGDKTLVNKCDLLGRTALHLAASYGNTKVLKLLLCNRASTHQKDSLHGLTPAQLAAARGDWELCSVFLDHGVMLHINVTECGDFFRKLCRKRDLLRMGKLFKSISTNLLPCSIREQLVFMRRIFLSADPDGNTGLHIAVTNDHTKIVEFILKTFSRYSNGKVTKLLCPTNSNHKTAFDSAILDNHGSIAEMITESLQSSWKLQDSTGCQFYGDGGLLGFLIQSMKIFSMELHQILMNELIKLDNLYLEDYYKKSVLPNESFSSEEDNNYEACKRMRHDMENFPLLLIIVYIIAQETSEDSIERLFTSIQRAGVRILPLVSQQYSQHKTLLLGSSATDTESLLQCFVKEAVHFSVNTSNSCFITDCLDRTPLHYACQLGSLEIVRLLVEEMEKIVEKLTDDFPVYEKAEGSASPDVWLGSILEDVVKNKNTILAYIMQMDFFRMKAWDYAGGRGQTEVSKFLMEKVMQELVILQDHAFKTIESAQGREWFAVFVNRKYTKKEYFTIRRISENKHCNIKHLYYALISTELRTVLYRLQNVKNVSYDIQHLVCCFLCNDLKISLSLLAETEKENDTKIKSNGLARERKLLTMINIIGGNLGYKTREILRGVIGSEFSANHFGKPRDVKFNVDNFIFRKDDLGRTYVHYAAIFGDLDFLKFVFAYILQNDANLFYHISEKDWYGKTPLHYSITGENVLFVRWILENLSNEQQSIQYLNSHLEVALEKNEILKYIVHRIQEAGEDVLQILQERHSAITLMKCAITTDNTQLPTWLLSKAENILLYLYPDKQYKTLLHYDALYGRGTVTKYVLQYIKTSGLNVLNYILQRDKEEKSVLDYALNCGNAGVLTELLEYLEKEGEDISILIYNCFHKNGRKMIDYVTEHNHVHLLRSLCKKLSLRKVNIPFLLCDAIEGESLILYAMKHSNVAVVKVLLENLQPKSRMLRYISLFTSSENPADNLNGSKERSDAYEYLLRKIGWDTSSIVEHLIRNEYVGSTLMYYIMDQDLEAFETVLRDVEEEKYGIYSANPSARQDFLTNLMFSAVINESSKLLDIMLRVTTPLYIQQVLKALVYYTNSIDKDCNLQLLVSTLKEKSFGNEKYILQPVPVPHHKYTFMQDGVFLNAIKHKYVELLDYIWDKNKYSRGDEFTFGNDYPDCIYYLLFAIEHADIHIFAYLLDKLQCDFSDINYFLTHKISEQSVLLHCAIKYEKSDILEFLLRKVEERGTDVLDCIYKRDKKSRTLVQYALGKLNLSMTEYPNIVSQQGNQTRSITYLSEQILKAEETIPEYIEVSDVLGILQNAVRTENTSLLTRLVQVLVKSGKCLTAYVFRHVNSATAIHYAARLENVEVLEFLMKCSAEDLPHHVPVEEQNCLLEYIFARDSMLMTPLDHAAECGRTEAADLLIKAVQGECIFHSKNCILDYIFYEYNYYEGYLPPLHYAARSGQIETAELLINFAREHVRVKGYNMLDFIFIKDNWLNTPLHLAAYGGHTNMVKFLIETANNEFIDTKNDDCILSYILYKDVDGMTPLHTTAKSGHLQTTELLINSVKREYDGNNNEDSALRHIFGKDNKGMTPLHHAVCSNNTQIVESLLKSFTFNDHWLQTYIFCKDNKGNTPLHYAAQCEDSQSMKLLIKFALELCEQSEGRILDFVSCKNKDGRTPLYYAVKSGRGESLIRSVHERVQITSKKSVI